ncbi:hypothetical protein B0T17DRAFT_618414 [Bombardia bombarda]|uniref:LYR motif-containing protein Cup1-like N-terminal domain-containing protein n=1 Tax=Bombardia bombarda TaxID=252184 RepID=A0AA39WUV8_9PEZI|nr:hypothetical protein B0T17DRAFT_618414 [Bombardia bombarda]
MLSRLPIPHPTTTLHLYRHLLREATYLPIDARIYATSRLKTRFRRYQKKQQDDVAPQVEEANSQLRYLRAANAGSLPRMRRVLLQTFGRVGYRRRKLTEEFVKPDMPTTVEEIEQYAAKGAAIQALKRKADWLDNWDQVKLRAFFVSQSKASLINSPKRAISHFQTNPEKQIPAENAWGRRLAPKLARNKLKRAWKGSVDKIYPPVAKSEWEKLRDLALGPAPVGVPKRRPVARLLSSDSNGAETSTWDWQAFATKPVTIVERQANRKNRLLSGAVDEHTPLAEPEPIDQHKYTTRLWRRIYGEVWQMTAYMEKKPTGKGWNIVWGGAIFQAPPASTAHQELFEDIAIDGKLLKKQSSKPTQHPGGKGQKFPGQDAPPRESTPPATKLST